MTPVEDAPALLLLDPYEQGRRGLAEFFREHGYAVAEVGDEAEALRAARRAPPGVVIVDPWPFPASLELVERLRSARPTGDASIVALSAAAAPEHRRMALAAGCHAYLEKPCPPDRVLAVVRRLLGV